MQSTSSREIVGSSASQRPPAASAQDQEGNWPREASSKAHVGNSDLSQDNSCDWRVGRLPRGRFGTWGKDSRLVLGFLAFMARMGRLGE